VNDFEIEPMLKSVAVVTGPLGRQISKTVSLLKHDPAVLDQRQSRTREFIRSISASEVGKSAADTEAERVNRNSNTDHAMASGRPHQLRFIVFAQIITIRFRGPHPAGWRSYRTACPIAYRMVGPR
jgi:hypothetical protein